MAKQNNAWVTISTQWIEKRGLGPLFKGAWATAEGDAVIEVANYNLADHSFVELDFNPPSLNGRPVRILIPRGAVETIVVPKNSKDLSLLGFKNTNE